MKRRTVVFGLGGVAVAAAGAGAWRHSTGSLSDYQAYQNRLRAPMAEDIRDVIRYSTLAANSHNTQPWRYRVEEAAIEILPDFARRTPVVDPDDHHLYVSLGCAAENLALAAAAAGMSGALSELGGEGGARFDFARGKSERSPLFDAIPLRQSTRGLYDGRAVPAGDIGKLAEAARLEGVSMILITEPGKRGQLRDLVIEANGRQMADPAFMQELKTWLRFSPKSAMRSGDGLFSAASGNPVMPDGLGGLAFDFVVTAASENDKYRRQMESSAGFAVFFGDGQAAADRIRTGRACQRFALAATAAGLKTAFLNQPVEVAEYRDALATIAGLPGKRPDILMRFGYGVALPNSPRRPVEFVLA